MASPTIVYEKVDYIAPAIFNRLFEDSYGSFGNLSFDGDTRAQKKNSVYKKYADSKFKYVMTYDGEICLICTARVDGLTLFTQLGMLGNVNGSKSYLFDSGFINASEPAYKNFLQANGLTASVDVMEKPSEIYSHRYSYVATGNALHTLSEESKGLLPNGNELIYLTRQYL